MATVCKHLTLIVSVLLELHEMGSCLQTSELRL